MSSEIGIKALTANAALKPFEGLIGEWITVGYHPYIPNTILHGKVSFSWLGNGAFLMMHTEIDNPKIPEALLFSVVMMMRRNLLCSILTNVVSQENMM